MYNILIATGLAAVAFAIGALGGKWYYGFVPALLVFSVAYTLLVRRIVKQFEGTMQSVQESIMRQDIKGAQAALEAALPLGKWQILVTQQIYAQLGTLEFLQRNYKAARPLLEKSWKRNWQAQGMLATLDARDGKREEGIKRLEKARTLARKEPLLWALMSYHHLEGGDRDAALAAVNNGLAAVPESKALKELQAAIANDRMKKFKWDRAFGEPWLQFFPEQAFRRAMLSQKQQIIQARRGMTVPQPRR